MKIQVSMDTLSKIKASLMEWKDEEPITQELIEAIEQATPVNNPKGVPLYWVDGDADLIDWLGNLVEDHENP